MAVTCRLRPLLTSVTCIRVTDKSDRWIDNTLTLWRNGFGTNFDLPVATFGSLFTRAGFRVELRIVWTDDRLANWFGSVFLATTCSEIPELPLFAEHYIIATKINRYRLAFAK